MDRKRLLLTGSAGFIGSNFIRKAVYEKQPYEIYSVDKIANSSMLNNIYQHKLHEFYIADICDRHIMDKIFEYVSPEIVVHMAAEASVDKSIKEPGIFVKTNVLGTQVMVELAVKYKVERFVHISTDECLGALKSPEEPSWDENSPINPLNPYSASKAGAEMLVKAAGNTHGLPFIITRSSNNFGPRQTADKLIPRTIKCIMNKQPIPVYGEGLQMRDWIHVQDNCAGIFRVLGMGSTGEIYNISANQEYTNINVVKTICDVMGEGHNLITHINDPRPGHDYRYSLNSNKLRKLGWAPVYKFMDGIRNCTSWFLDNPFFLRTSN